MNKNILICLLFILITSLTGCAQNKTINNKNQDMNYNKLTPEEEHVIVNKGTEKPFTGKYYNFNEKGTYVCKSCNEPLYRSDNKFDSGCGWPSFDDEIQGAVRRQTDADGYRTEILCSNCGAHLGHVFSGEGFTPKNIRHCVNSISLNFIPDSENAKTDTAIFAGGCFWGMEYHFRKAKGVISATAGYTGGSKENPTYQEVCSGMTGHAEAIEVVFNTSETSFEQLAKLFFEIHDPAQLNRQGPDIGEQYRSEIFYLNNEQREISEKLISILKNKGYKVVTKLTESSKFWKAEDYHQDYYNKKGDTPYCHIYTKRF